MNEPKPTRAAVGAWVSYDVANTVFWTGVVGLAFPLWLIDELGGSDATLGYSLAAIMVVVLMASPILGAISDQMGRRMPLLLAATLSCVAATLALGNGGMLLSLVLFGIALSTMELGTIFYNSLLPEVSTEANRGLVSGLGTGIGYVGSFIAVAVALVLTDPKGHVFVFHVIAILFLVFSLPIFLLLREKRKAVRPGAILARIGQAFTQLNSNARNLHLYPGLRQFLMGRFFYGMGINTAVAFAVIYASETVGLSDRKIQLILLAGISIAIPGGVFWGRMVDRIGPGKVLSYALILWVALLLVAIGIPWLSWSTHLYWLVGCLTGLAMSGIWTADRPYMLTFTPTEYTGEFFGFHGMVGKMARVVGPFMWAFISSTLGFGQPAAVLALVFCLLVSYAILTRLRAPMASPTADLAD